MSEKLTPSMEGGQKIEVQRTTESLDRNEAKPLERKSEIKSEEINTIKQKIEVEAKSREETTVDKAIPPQTSNHLVGKDLKEESLRRSLQRTRKQLAVGDKVLSKAIHQPVVNLISKVGESTIARPTGILTGSLVALIGSSYVLYMAKHYGFVYNYWIIFILFGGGYVIGLVIELLIFAFKKGRHSSN